MLEIVNNLTVHEQLVAYVCRGRLGVFGNDVAVVRHRLEAVLVLQFLVLFGSEAQRLCFSQDVAVFVQRTRERTQVFNDTNARAINDFING